MDYSSLLFVRTNINLFVFADIPYSLEISFGKMKFTLCLFLFCSWKISSVNSIKDIRVGLGEPIIPINTNVIDVEDKWFVQNLDHFNPTDTRTWKQVTSTIFI